MTRKFTFIWLVTTLLFFFGPLPISVAYADQDCEELQNCNYPSPGDIVNFSASNTDNSSTITSTWDVTPDAWQYWVDRQVNGGAWTLVYLSRQLSFTDTNVPIGQVQYRGRACSQAFPHDCSAYSYSDVLTVGGSVDILQPVNNYSYNTNDNVYVHVLTGGLNQNDLISFQLNDGNIVTKINRGHDYGVLSSGSHTIKVWSEYLDSNGRPVTTPIEEHVFTVKYPPTITGQNSIQADEDTAYTLTVSSFSVSDSDSDTFTLSVQDGANYTRTGNTITPDTDFVGVLSVPVTVSDGQASSEVFNANVTVNAINDAPVIISASIPAFNEDSSQTILVSDINITDSDSSSFTLSVQDGSNYSRNGNDITPDADFNGTLTVPITVSDGIASSDVFNASVTINPVNDKPVIQSESFHFMDEDTSFTVSVSNLYITDIDSSEFSVNVLDGENYTRVNNTITPDPDFNGDLVVPLTASDGLATSDVFNGTMRVSAINDKPVINSSSIPSIDINSSLTILVSHLDVTDVDSGDYTFVLSVQDGDNYTRDGNTITPNEGFIGSLFVPMTVSDGEDSSDVFIADLSVENINDPPIINSASIPSFDEDSSLTILVSHLDVTDSDSSSFTLSVQDGTGYSRDGNKITPSADFNGVLTVPLTVSDGEASSDVFEASVTVNAVNDKPLVLGHSFPAIEEDSSFTILVSHLTIADVDSSEFTVAVLDGENYTRVNNTITPNQDFNGDLIVMLTVSDGSDTSDVFNGTLVVSAKNDEPQISQGDVIDIVTDMNVPVAFGLDASDPESSLLTWSESNAPSHGSVDGFDADGFGTGNSMQLTYIPQANFSGADSFNIQVSDGSLTDSVTVNVTINAGTPLDIDSVVPDADVVNVSVPAHNPAVGEIKLNPSASGGIASLSIPIAIAPGRLKMQPSISLNYSHISGNGIVGKGWSLSGAGAISRCSAIDLEDNESRSVQMKVDDKLCLNGKKLVLVDGGSYGNQNTEYRTIRDEFSKIELLGGNSLSSSSYFKVTTNAGIVEYYGTDASQVKPISWLLHKKEDQYGNNVIYQYHDSYGEVYVEDIYYTGFDSQVGTRQIHFDYESRPDKSYAHRYGSNYIARRTKRLSDISVLVDDNIIYDYALTYDESPVTGVSRITSIELCATDEQDTRVCLPSREFTWSGQQISFDTKTDTVDFFADIQYWNAAKQIIADLNADGVLDFVVFNKFYPGIYDPQTEEYSLDTENAVVIPFDATGQDNIHAHAVTDFNRDGKTDLIGKLNNKLAVAMLNETNDGFVLKNLNTSFKCGETHDQASDGDQFSYGEVFYDRNDCSVTVVPDGKNGSLVFFRSIFKEIRVTHFSDDYGSSGVTTPRLAIDEYDGVGLRYQEHATDVTFNKPRYFDFEGDGDIDIVIVSRDNKVIVYEQNDWDNFANITFTKTVHPFNLSDHVNDLIYSRSAHEDGGVQWMDINGDGLKDMVAVGYVSSVDEYQWHIAINKGGTLAPFVNTGLTEFKLLPGRNPLPVPRPGSNFSAYIKIIDFNNDGREDMMVPTGTVDDQRRCTTVTCNNGNDEIDPLIRGVVGVTSHNWMVYLANGDENNPGFTAYDPDIVGTYNYFFSVDLNHDGTLDFLTGENLTDPAHWINATQYVKTFIRKHSDSDIAFALRPDLLTHAKDVGVNKYGNNVEFKYVPYSHSNSSQPDNSIFAKGYKAIRTSQTVVDSMLLTNMLGTENELSIDYGYPIFNFEGLGFIGFDSITSTDVRRGISTTTDYKHEFPLNGYTESKIKTVDSTNTVVESTTYEFCGNGNDPKSDCLGFHNGVFVINTTKSEKRNYELDGHLFSTVSQELIDFDDRYGNLLEEKTVTSDDLMAKTESVVNTYFDADESDWWVNKLKTTKTSAVVVYDDDKNIVDGTNNEKWTRSTVAYKENSLRQIDSILNEASDTSVTNMVKFNSYDQWGNSTETTKYGYSVPGVAYSDSQHSVTSQLDYSETDGYFATTEHNGLWDEAVTTKTWSKRFGKPIKETEVNGNWAENKFDAFGFVLEKTSNTSPTVFASVDWCGSTCIENAVAKTTVASDGKPKKITQINRKGKELKSLTEGFGDGEWVITLSSYNELGQTTQTVAPHYEGEEQSITFYDSYDELGRNTRKTVNRDPMQYFVDYSYDGIETTITASSYKNGNKVLKQKVNSIGQKLAVMDANSKWSYFRFDASGNPIAVTDVGGNVITAMFDGFGHKQWVNDPNSGRTDFVVNGLGELRWQKDANGDEHRTDYDDLGRVSKIYINNVLDITNIYDTRKKGLLSSSSKEGVSEELFYDSKLNIIEKQINITSPSVLSLSQKTAFDGYYNRPKAIQYPSGEFVGKSYNSRGFSTSEYNPLLHDQIYRSIISLNADGQIKAQEFSNGLYAVNEYYSSGEHSRACVGGVENCNSDQVADIYYSEFDDWGNLTKQYDFVNKVEEVFVYDDLHRLTKSTRTSLGEFIPVFIDAVVDYDYAVDGNMIKKSDYFQDAVYGVDAGPNAITSIKNRDGIWLDFSYDDNGNQTSGDGRTTIFNSFNKPTKITKGGNVDEFKYGVSNARYFKKSSSNGEVTRTFYFGGYEKVETTASGQTTIEERHYLGDYGVLTFKDNQREISYLHGDRLGSNTLVTDGNSHKDNVASLEELVKERRGYDAFGKARDQHWGDSLGGLLNSSVSDRGFTTHEHLDSVELTHMNGRVYDYNLGRFLSVDPFIVDPDNSQSYNPYSYIMNNPLSGTDPSGYAQVRRPSPYEEDPINGWASWNTANEDRFIQLPQKKNDVDVGDIDESEDEEKSKPENKVPTFDWENGTYDELLDFLGLPPDPQQNAEPVILLASRGGGGGGRVYREVTPGTQVFTTLQVYRYIDMIRVYRPGYTYQTVRPSGRSGFTRQDLNNVSSLYYEILYSQSRSSSTGRIRGQFSSTPESYIRFDVSINMGRAPNPTSFTVRNAPRQREWFWREMLARHPQFFNNHNRWKINNGYSPIINAQWIKHFPTHRAFKGETLVHHHILQGFWATPIPTSIHQSHYTSLHPYMRLNAPIARPMPE